MKRSVSEENAAILSVNAPNTITTMYVKQKLIERDKFTIMVENINSSL